MQLKNPATLAHMLRRLEEDVARASRDLDVSSESPAGVLTRSFQLLLASLIEHIDPDLPPASLESVPPATSATMRAIEAAQEAAVERELDGDSRAAQRLFKLAEMLREDD